MEAPNSPTIEPSEPEMEQRKAEAGIERALDPGSPSVIGLEAVRDFLIKNGLDLDKDGFIVDLDSQDFVEPYAFSKERFDEVESPVENPLETYCIPESECRWLVAPKEKVHLTDLHTIYWFGEKAHPIRDDKLSLLELGRKTGVTFNYVTEWSDSKDLIKDSEYDGPIVTFKFGEKTVELNCFECEFRGQPQDWDGGEEDELKCPECGCKWDTNGIETCTSCQTTFRWDDIVPEDGGGPYWEPSCPDCGAGLEYLKSENRYHTFDSITPDIPEEPEYDYLEEEKETDKEKLW